MRAALSFHRLFRRSTGLFVGIVLVTAPAVVLASHNFSDVGDGHPFHSEISAVANAGIARGFGDGTYRPGDPVTRQAMAAFLERGVGRVGADGGGFAMRLGQPGSVAEVTVESGAAANGGGFVLLQGNAAAFANGSNSALCPCAVQLSIEGDDIGTIFEVPGTASSVGYAANSGFVSAVKPIEADTTRTYRLIARVLGVASGDPDIHVQATLTALYVPLSADGDDTSTFERTCPQDDGYEPNDSVGQSTNMFSGGVATRPDAIVCPSDDDWFYLGFVSTSQSLSVFVEFQNSQGNIDICVTNASETFNACSQTTDNGELLGFVPPASEEYFVRVYLATDAGTPGNTYRVAKEVS